MKRIVQFVGALLLAFGIFSTLGATKACAQDPIVTPIVVDTATAIIVSAVKPKPTGLVKFEGYVVNANQLQLTVRDRNNETALRTFTLGEKAVTQMQKVVDKGGYQYGDKITVYYDPSNLKAVKFKGKPSRSL